MRINVLYKVTVIDAEKLARVAESLATEGGGITVDEWREFRTGPIDDVQEVMASDIPALDAGIEIGDVVAEAVAS